MLEPADDDFEAYLILLCLYVSQELFSTKYQLSFNSVMNRGGTASTKELVVGRSRQCDMVLDYRYVEDFDHIGLFRAAFLATKHLWQGASFFSRT